MKIFLVCPVRNATPEETAAIAKYVFGLEKAGYAVYWPARDTNQDDKIGLGICTKNRAAISEADEVRIWFNPTSQGTLFDIGMAFALGKKIILANPEAILPTPNKSFGNVLLHLHNKNDART